VVLVHIFAFFFIFEIEGKLGTRFLNFDKVKETLNALFECILDIRELLLSCFSNVRNK